MSFPTSKQFKSEKLYFLLPVDKPGIPERVRSEATKEGLFGKFECHISVVVEKSAVSIRAGILKNKNPEKAKEEIISLFESLAWEYDLTDTFSLQEKSYNRKELDERGLEDEPEHIRRSIVQVVKMPDIGLFYKKISEILNIELSTPIAHITIFAYSDYEAKKTRGIGISSKEDFEMFNKKFI